MNFEEFLKRQNDIYDEISKEGKLLSEKGITPNKDVLKGEKGYIIGLRHPESISGRIESVSNQIARHVLSIVYKKDNVHTTIFSRKIELSDEFDKSFLNFLVDTVGSVKIEKMAVNYERFLYNSNSVIAAGMPDKRFYLTCKSIIEELVNRNIDAALHKMAHITVSRFLEKANPDSIESFQKFIENVNILGKSRPPAIFIGKFHTSESAFRLNIYKEIELD